MSKGTVVILVIVGCILLAVANVALWASLDLFNPGRFGERVAEGLQSDAASQALAGAIVDRIMEYYPEFPPLAQVPAEEVVAWLLQRPVLPPLPRFRVGTRRDPAHALVRLAKQALQG